MTDLITRDPNDTGEIPPPDLTSTRLAFYSDTTECIVLRPDEPPICDARPVLVTTARPKSLADTPDGPAPQPLPAPGPPPAPDPYAEVRAATSKPLLRRGRRRPPAPLWAWAVAVAALALAAGGVGGGLVLAGAVLAVAP
jgi:hypothetical protein